MLWDLQDELIRLDGTGRFEGRDDEESDITDPAAPARLVLQEATYEGFGLSKPEGHVVAGGVHATARASRVPASGTFLAIDVSTTFADDGTAELVLDGERHYHVLLDDNHAGAE